MNLCFILLTCHRRIRKMKHKSKKEKIITKISNFSFKHSKIFIIIVISITTFLSLGLKDLKISTSLSKMYSNRNQYLIAQKEFESVFNKSEYIGILVKTDDIFSPQTVETIKLLKNDIENNVPLVANTTSIINFFDDREEMSLEANRKILDSSSNIKGSLYTEDYKQTWVYCNLKAETTKDQYKNRNFDPSFSIGKEILTIIDKYQSENISLLPSGYPIILYRNTLKMIEIMSLITILAFCLILVISVLSFKSLKVVLISLTIPIISLSSILGLMGWLKISIYLPFLLIPILISLVVSFKQTYSYFVCFKINSNLTIDKSEIFKKTNKEIGYSIGLTSTITTLILACFLLVPVIAFQSSCIITIILIILIQIFTLTFFPLFLLKIVSEDQYIKKSYSWQNIDWGRKSLISFFLIALTLLCISGFGITKLNLDLSEIITFQEDSDYRSVQDEIEFSTIGSNMALNIALIFPEINGSLSKSKLEKVSQLTNYLEQSDFVKRTTSINDIIKEINALRHRGNEDFFKIPEKEAAIRGIVGFTRRKSEEIISNLIDKENRKINILVELANSSVIEQRGFYNKLNEEIKIIFPNQDYNGFQYFVVGIPILFNYLQIDFSKGIILSMILSFFIILCFFSILGKSLKNGLSTTIVYFILILSFYGVIGYLKIGLNIYIISLTPVFLCFVFVNPLLLTRQIKSYISFLLTKNPMK